LQSLVIQVVFKIEENYAFSSSKCRFHTNLGGVYPMNIGSFRTKFIQAQHQLKNASAKEALERHIPIAGPKPTEPPWTLWALQGRNPK